VIREGVVEGDGIELDMLTRSLWLMYMNESGMSLY